MAWNNIKITIPGVGERAYIFSNYIDNNGNCVPNTPNLRSCCYFANESWDVGQPLNGIYPSVGDWFTYTDTFSNAGQGQVACYKVLEIIDETMYNNGTCTVCPSTSPCGTNCVYTTAPYTPPPNGIAVTFWQTPVANANDFTAGITNNCSYCLLGQVVTPNTGNPPAWAECCGPHALLYAGRTTEVYPPTNIGGSWILPDNNVIPILPDDIGLPYCAFRGLNEPVSNGNLIVSPIDLWDDPQGWNQSTTIPSLTNWVDVHSFTNYISQAHPYYDKISNQPLNDFLDGIIILPITGHSSLTSVHPQPFQTNTYPVYQEDLRGDGCECSGESTTSVFTCPCLAQSPTYVSQADITTYGSVQNAINNLSGPTAYFNTHNISSFCVTNGCPDPNVAGNCLKVPLTARFSNFGDTNNATYGPLVWNGGGGWVSPYTTQNGTQVGYNYQQIIDWLNLVASTEGYVGGFTTSMTIAQLITLAQSQNTYTNQDYYDAQVNAGISTTVYPNVYPQDSVIPTPFVGAGASLCTGSQTTTTTTPETADVMFLGGFELIEKYITSPVSNYGTRMTNVLASGSWDNIRNFLYSAGMPNTYLSYDDARPWFESNANSAAMGLQTVVNPQAYPDNAPNRVNIFNDVYVINKSLTTRCPNGLPIGCTDQTATNYDPNALVNCDGSVLGSIQPGWNSCCNYIGQGCGAAVCWDCDLVTYSCYISSTGPYSSLQQCATACTDCSCVKVIGTGHTGGYYYTAQTNCDEDCCGGPSVGLCDVLIVGDDVGVLHYDPATHSTTHLFSDNSYDRYDIAASYDKIWIYTITGGGTKIKEFDITLSPFTLSYSRTITVPAYGIGKGLTFYGLNKLVCANTKVEVVDITPNAGQIGTISTLFSLPGGTSCTGDLVYTGTMGGVGSMFVILYGTANVKKVGKFTPTGVLIQDAVIPSTILTGTTFMDSLFTDVDTNTIYGITDDARVYELQQTPVLQFAPISTPMNSPIPLPGLVAGTGKIHGADNIQAPNNMAIELSCSSGITIPVSYNCSVAGTSIGCVDPGDGTGDYTGTTALFDCQNQTPGAGGCIVTWNCDPGNPGTECANVTVNLPWPSVWNKNSALAYIAHPGMGLQYTSLDQISYAGGSPQPGQCFIQTSSGSKPQWRVSYFQVSVVSNQNMYHWAYFINQCVLQGVPVNLSMTLQTVINKIALFYNIPSVSVMKIWTSPCICTAQPCDCFPVLGSSGQYPTEALCQIPCCGPDPCIKCCINKQGHQIQMSPNANPCKCPFGWVEIPCGPQGPCHPNVSCAPGYHWSYVHCRCVCDQQPCPWNWTWDDVTCNCVPNIMASKIPSDKYRDPKGTDITLARGVYDFEVSALTTTNTSFSTGGGVTTTGGGVGSGTGSGQDRFKLTETGCLMCERNQSEDYYKANNCIYTNSQCGEESVLTYYICSSATNPVVGESQKACIPQDIQPSSGVYYNNLESCLNSGCGGYMWCEAGQIVNGVNFEGYETQAYSPIPMCCSSMIQNTPQGKHVYSYTSSGPLTVSSCQSGCKDAPGDTWFPLYNAFGTNTFSESPLAYLTRELLLQVNVGQCIASTSDDKFVRLGYTKINPY
tara:strand:+ start:591 stop:5351 length:4761 start_codon:yes stop_codon:yes gene_type:complete